MGRDGNRREREREGRGREKEILDSARKMCKWKAISRNCHEGETFLNPSARTRVPKSARNDRMACGPAHRARARACTRAYERAWSLGCGWRVITGRLTPAYRRPDYNPPPRDDV